MTPLLETHELAAGYGGPPVLEDVSFAAVAGERIGVLGPNGGGKSTLFRVLLGDENPDGVYHHAIRPLASSFKRAAFSFDSQSDVPVRLMIGVRARIGWYEPQSRDGVQRCQIDG